MHFCWENLSICQTRRNSIPSFLSNIFYRHYVLHRGRHLAWSKSFFRQREPIRMRSRVQNNRSPWGTGDIIWKGLAAAFGFLLAVVLLKSDLSAVPRADLSEQAGRLSIVIIMASPLITIPNMNANCPPASRVDTCVCIYIICHSCRSTSLWGCLLARLGDEPDRGWPRTAAGSCVDGPCVDAGCQLRWPLEKMSQIKPVGLEQPGFDRRYSALFCRRSNRALPVAKPLVARQRGRPAGIPFADEDIPHPCGENFSKLIFCGLTWF